jgi:trigger factor
MQVTRTNNSSSNVALRISADAGDLAPIHHHVLGHFAKQVKVPGFRVGHAPANVIEKHVDQKALLDEFMEHALNDLYRRAIESEKIRPVGQPNVTVKKFVPFTNLEFEAQMDVIAPIKLADYKKIELPKPPVNIAVKEVNDVIKSLQQRMAERTPVERAAKAGDEVIIDFSGSDKDGKAVAGADGKDYPLLLGSNTFIPGFEDHLVGLKAGDSPEFTIKFPANYGVAALQSKEVTFKVDVKKVAELAEPKVDDGFAAKTGPFKNLAELKTDIKKQLSLERQQQADREFENQLVQAITAKSTVEAPKSLVDEQILRAEEEEKRNLTYRGQTWQEHLKEEGVTEEQHRERNRAQTEERVKAGLVLNEIAELEKIEVTPEELEIRLQILKGQYQDGAMQAELDKPENRQEIASRIMTEKTLAKLVEYVAK